MARKKENAIRDLRQVLVRVPEDAYRVFEMAKVAYQHRSIQELLRPVLEEHAETLRAKPQIQAMLRNSAELQAEELGTLRKLPDRQAPDIGDLNV